MAGRPRGLSGAAGATEFAQVGFQLASPADLQKPPGDRALVSVYLYRVAVDTVHRNHVDASAVQRIADHPTLWAYARRLAAHPAFGGNLDLGGIERRHHARCHGLEAAVAAVQILDWAAHSAH